MRKSDFAELSRIVRAESGLVLDDNDAYAITSRLTSFARNELHVDLSTLLASLPSAGRELRRAICEALTVNETRFFRDENVFAALRDKVIPDALVHSDRLEIWSAAAASGQEPYSVAMVLRESFPRVRVRITATDLAGRMIERVVAATYSDFEIRRGLSAEQRTRHFTQVAAGWRANRELRAMVHATPLDLAGEWPTFPQFDIILLRNVLVYLDEPTRDRIRRNAAKVLAPHGVLALGAAEAGPMPGLERMSIGSAVFYRHQERR